MKKKISITMSRKLVWRTEIAERPHPVIQVAALVIPAATEPLRQPRERGGWWANLLRMLTASVVLAATSNAWAQAAPVTLRLERVDATSRSNSVGTATHKVEQSGNSFTLSLTYSEARGTGTMNFKVDLPSATFTDSRLVNGGLQLTPSPRFQITRSVNGTGVAGGGNYIISSNTPTGTTLNPFDCTGQVPPDATSVCQFGVLGIQSNLARINITLTVGFASMTASALYNYRPEAPVDPVDLRFGAIDVLQVVSTGLPNGGKLAPGKATLVRVIPTVSGNEAITGIRATLQAKEFPGEPLEPQNQGEGVAKPSSTYFYTDGTIDGPLEFLLPSHWLNGRELTLTATVNFGGTRIESAPKENNTSAPLVLQFDDELRFSPLIYEYLEFCIVGSDRTPVCPQYIEYAGELLRQVLPIAENRIDFSPVPLPPVYVPDEYRDTSGYEYFLSVQTATLKVMIERARANVLNYRLLLAWPKDVSSSSSLVANDCRLKPEGCVERMKRSFASAVLDKYGATAERESDIATVGFNGGDPSLILPSAPNSVAVAGGWIGRADYAKLIGGMKRRLRLEGSGAVATKPAPKFVDDATGSLIVSGGVDPSARTAQLEPLYRLPGAAPELSPEGAWCVRLQRANGGAPVDSCFDLENTNPGSAPFAVAVPNFGDLARVSLIRRELPDAELASMTATADPVIFFNAPQAGDIWEGTRTLTWTAADPAGNELTYLVFYSSDGGGIWLPLAAKLKQSQLEVDISKIMGGKNILFRVIASSGFNSAYADAGPIELRQNLALTATSPTLDFRSRTIGEAVRGRITLTNTGNGPLVVQAAVPADSPFELPATRDRIVIPAGRSRDVVVGYRPRVKGPEEANIEFTSNAPPVSVRVRGTGSDTPVPMINVADRFDFGRAPTNVTRSVAIAIRNEGRGELQILSASSDNAVFQPTAGALAIGAAKQADLMVQVRPVVAGLVTGRLTLRTNDPSRPTVTIEVTVTGETPPAPVITLSPAAPFNLGSVNLGSTATLAVTLANSGGSALVINSITRANQAFSPVEALPLTVPVGGTARLTIRFAPASTGAVSDTWTLVTTPASVVPPFAVSGTGVAMPSATTATLAIDGGVYSITAGFPGGGATGYFVNRLTPPSYPATLRSVLVFFGQGELPVGAAVSVLSASNPSGTGGQTLTGLTFQRTPATIGAQEVFSEIPVPALTITSGDFVVGFSAPNPVGIYPMVVDTDSGSKARSYLSSDGATFRLADSSNVGAGNFGIRARVDLGGGGTGSAVLRTSVASLVMDATAVNATSPARTLTVSNSGTAGATATLTVTGPFTVTPASAVLAAGASTTVSVTFRPVAATPAAQTGTLTISAPGVPSVTVALSGTVAASGGGTTSAVLEVQAGNPLAVITSWDFGSVPVAGNEAAFFRVYNKSANPVAVSASFVNARFTLVIPAAQPFGLSQGGGWIGVRIDFKPLATDTIVQTGSVTFSAGGQSVTIALRATPTGGTGGGGTAGCVTVPSGLVSWYGGDGNALDTGSAANNGTLQAGTTYATGQVGQAFNFNGTSGYVQLGDPANLRLTTGMSIEAWINPRSVRAQIDGPAMGAIVTKWAQVSADTANSDSYGLWVINSGGSLNLFGAIHQTGPREPNIQGGTIPLNTWTHVAMTFDGASGAYRLYVNGAQVASQTSVGNLYPTNRNVNIGREDSYIQRLFDGLIDEPTIYSRALTATEIQAIFNAGTAGKCRGGVTPPPAAGYSVTVTPTTVAAGRPVTVSWTDPGPNFVRNWVGLYQVGVTPTDSNLLRPAWQYTERASGTIQITIPGGTAPGRYVFHYFANDNYGPVLASSSVITVTP